MKLYAVIAALLLGVSAHAYPTLLGNGTCSNATVTSVVNVTYLPNTFDEQLNTNILVLAGNASRSNNFASWLPDLATNQSLWTWPLDLSCVGIGNGFSLTLLTPTVALFPGHVSVGAGPWVPVQFMGRDGVLYTNMIHNQTNVYGDTSLVTLSNVMPSVSTAKVLPPNYTNFMLLDSHTNWNGFWCRRNSYSVNYSTYIFNKALNSVSEASNSICVTAVANRNMPAGRVWSAASGGDSGSPQFIVMGTNAVVIGDLYCSDLVRHQYFNLFSGPDVQNGIANSPYAFILTQLNYVDLSNLYRLR